MARIPAPEADRTRRCKLLAMAIDLFDSQADASRVLGVSEAAISLWLRGEREVEWWMVIEAMRRAMRRAQPHDVARVAQVLMLELLDQHGAWQPPIRSDELGDVSEEAGDVVVALGEATQAARTGNPEAKARAAQHLLHETRELAEVLTIHGSGK